MNDFNYYSLHQKLSSFVLLSNRGPFQGTPFLTVKLNNDNVMQTVDLIESKWKEFEKSQPFSYFFFDSYLDDLYTSEQTLKKVFGIFSFLAILVACIGLFGLAVYTTQQRIKEIGIRKALGAKIYNVVYILATNFTFLIAIAFVLAVPVAYLGMNNFLSRFEFNVGIKWWIFALSAFISFFIAIVTILSQAINAARKNPVDTLRYE
jgi:putative ABC transport system permease protein